MKVMIELSQAQFHLLKSIENQERATFNDVAASAINVGLLDQRSLRHAVRDRMKKRTELRPSS